MRWFSKLLGCQYGSHNWVTKEMRWRSDFNRWIKSVNIRWNRKKKKIPSVSKKTCSCLLSWSTSFLYMQSPVNTKSNPSEDTQLAFVSQDIRIKHTLNHKVQTVKRVSYSSTEATRKKQHQISSPLLWTITEVTKLLNQHVYIFLIFTLFANILIQ